MQSDFLKVICQMGIFMICAQAIVHFRPKASYEKYLKLLVSAMMVMQMFLFVGGIFSADGGRELKERTEWFGDYLNKSMEEVAEKTFFSGEELGVQITGQDPEQTNGQETEIAVQIAPVEQIHIGTVQ